jgi:hypothetical protein
MPENPFRALGLDAEPGLTDDDIRAAWHRVAAATHPDRADGGDPAAFSAAAAAYSDLRTPFGRGEARADLARRSASGRRHRHRHRPGRWPPWAAPDGAIRALWHWRPGGSAGVSGRWAGRLRGGRPVRLAVLVAGGAGVSVLAVIIDGWQPASVALIVGAATWVLAGARRYLGAGTAVAEPPAGRWPQPGAGPVATGRAASVTQPDQEPG